MLSALLFAISLFPFPASSQKLAPTREKNFINRATMCILNEEPYPVAFEVKINRTQPTTFPPPPTGYDYGYLDTLRLSAENGWYTLAVPLGKQYRILLPGMTVRVYLNAGSVLKFCGSGYNPDANPNRLYLEGEAMIAVDDRKTPFEICLPDGLTLTTNGTTINVTAYPDDPAFRFYTLWGECRINVHRPNISRLTGENMTQEGYYACWIRSLKRMYTGGLAPTAETYWDNFSSYAYLPTDWISGNITVVNEDIYSTFRKIGRWYNRQFVFQDSVPNTRLTFTVRDLMAALKTAQRYNLSSYLKNDSIIFYKNKNPQIPPSIDNRQF